MADKASLKYVFAIKFMGRHLAILIFLASFSSSYSQSPNSKLLKQLSAKITHGITEPKGKLDAIFHWVTENIEYDVSIYKKFLTGRNMYEDFNLKYSDSVEYHEAVAAMVVNRKKAVCDGYSRLFKSLCNYASIQCEVVTGKTKSFLDEELQPHAWNAVRLSGKWYLVDPTWASGYVTDEFTKKLDMFYYLTPPEKMFVNHFPEEQRWTLLDKSFNFDRFTQCPVEDISVIKKGLIDYYPKTKNINLHKGKLTTIWLLFDKPPSELSIEVSAKGWSETRASRLNIEITEKVYDSLYNIDPDYFKEIEKIQIVSKKITGNKVEFVIKPVADIKGVQIHVEYGFPALVYDISSGKKSLQGMQ
jgi:hypothetical protein